MQAASTSTHWVAKFGGTSVATYEAMTRCAKLLAHYPKVRVVVVSAPAGVTNLLVKLTQSSFQKIDLGLVLGDIKTKIHAILKPLPTSIFPALRKEVEQMLQSLDTLAARLSDKYDRSLADELLSYGERLSARLFASVLAEQGFSAAYQDARELIATNDHFGKAEVLLPATDKNVKTILLPKCSTHVVVTEGFIGSTLENKTTTLGRGGSDYSAAILAEAMPADVLQIWTDVPGIYTVDPGLVANARPIENMCFTEAAEMATFGAKVLHPATLWPAIRKNIPVFVGSSMNQAAVGTWIRAANPQMDAPLLRAIALRRHQSILTINSLEMLHTHGFLAKVFSVLANHQLSVDLVTTSEVSVALTLNHSDRSTDELLTPEILAELQAIGNVSLKVDKDLCLIALVGNQLHMTKGVSGRIFNLLRSFNVRLICHGASPHNVCFLVSETDAKAVVQAMHAEFFEN